MSSYYSDLNRNPYLPQIVKLAALARTLTPRRKILALLATWAIDGLSDLNTPVLLYLPGIVSALY